MNKSTLKRLQAQDVPRERLEREARRMHRRGYHKKRGVPEYCELCREALVQRGGDDAQHPHTKGAQGDEAGG